VPVWTCGPLWCDVKLVAEQLKWTFEHGFIRLAVIDDHRKDTVRASVKTKPTSCSSCVKRAFILPPSPSLPFSFVIRVVNVELYY
jgi:hypothetical protein